MAQLRTPLASYPRRGPPPSAAGGEGRVAEMRGEYDLSNVAPLCKMLSAAIAIDDADLVLDASEVTFLDAATISVLVRTRIFLKGHSRSLIVRSPSPCVRRIFDICDLDEPIETTDDRRAARDQVAVGALGTWVAVPATTPTGHPSSCSPDETPSQVVTTVGDDSEETQRSASSGVSKARTEPRSVAPSSVAPTRVRP